MIDFLTKKIPIRRSMKKKLKNFSTRFNMLSLPITLFRMFKNIFFPHLRPEKLPYLVMRIYNIIIPIAFTLLIVIPESLLSREISFLPAYIIGEAPAFLQKKDNVSEGMADLLSFYARENFEVDATDSDKIRNYLESIEETPEKKPGKDLITAICAEFDSDYVVKSEIDFSGDVVIQTTTFNCKGRAIYSSESVIQGDFYLGMERHAVKTFTYLSPKRKKAREIYKEEELELVYVLDLSGSVAKDSEAVLKYISSLLGQDISIGLVLVGEKDVKVIKPSREHSRLREEIPRIRFGGEVNIEHLSSSLIKIKGELLFSTAKNRRMILFTDAQSREGDPYKLVSTLQSVAQIGFQTFLVTGSFFDFKMSGIYRKAARSTGQDLQQVLHYVKVGTMKGYKTLYLYDRRVYIDSTGKLNPADLELKELTQIPEGSVYKLVSFPHPNNLVEIFSGYSGEKIIEKGQISSNIMNVMDRLTNQSTGDTGRVYRKVLVKVQNHSFWIQVKSAPEQFLNQEVGIRAVFRKQFSNSMGYTNVPDETYVYSENVPRLLILEPSEIKNYLSNTNKDTITCFIRGKVLEIK